MRSSLFALLGTMALAQAANAQSYPAIMSITAPDGIEVRSGPTVKYYATNKLAYGARVLVMKKSEQEDGWLAIKPPPGSFSWINEKDIRQLDPHTGYVDSDNAKVRVGSFDDKRAPDVESVRVPRGEIVTILDKGRTTESGTWFQIAPSTVELRYIPGEAVQKREEFASINKAGQAPIPGHPAATTQSANWVPGQLASLSQTAPAPAKLNYPPTWSQVGILRRAADKDGQPTYLIMDTKNNVLLYAVCQPNFTLKDYVGRTVALYGSITYQSNDYMRRQYMTASLVAVY